MKACHIGLCAPWTYRTGVWFLLIHSGPNPCISYGAARRSTMTLEQCTTLSGLENGLRSTCSRPIRSTT